MSFLDGKEPKRETPSCTKECDYLPENFPWLQEHTPSEWLEGRDLLPQGEQSSTNDDCKLVEKYPNFLTSLIKQI